MKKNIPGIIILLCAVTVIVWQAVGLLISRTGSDFALKAEDFESFQLKFDGWIIEQLEVVSTFMEVNLLQYRCRFPPRADQPVAEHVAGCTLQQEEQERELTAKHAKNAKVGADPDQSTNQPIIESASSASEPSNLEPDFAAIRRGTPSTFNLTNAPILVRLVHGYNMRDCMRIKGYAVDEINGGRTEGGNLKPENGIGSVMHESTNQQIANGSHPAGGKSPEAGADLPSGFRSQVSSFPHPPQLWLITSPSGDKSLWMSGILRAGDFSPLNLSVTDMPFPRVGTPTDPNWIPRGLTWTSLRHPIRNFKYFLNAKWNAARCDLLTFLRLRKPAWASDDALTLLVIRDISPAESEEEIAALLQEIFTGTQLQLHSWARGGEIIPISSSQ